MPGGLRFSGTLVVAAGKKRGSSTSVADFLNNRLDTLRWSGRALRSRNYRLFFAGQGLSLIGTWMQRIAMSWLVYRLTNSPLLLGSVDFASQISAFAVGPLAGLVADRVDRRRFIIVTQILSMVQAGVLAALVLTHHIQVWHLFALGICLGVINGFDMPSRQALVPEMVTDKLDLPNAIALNSGVFNAARFVGPALAGLVVAAVGEGFCFLLNAVSYIAVVAALLAMRFPPHERPPAAASVWHGLREGFAYAFGSIPIRSVLLLMSLFSLAGTPYMSLMPVFAKQVMHGGPQTLGFLVSCSGVGAVCGAMYLASRRELTVLPKLMAVAGLCFSVGLLAFSRSSHLHLSMGLMVLTGFGLMVQMASANTLLQTLAPDDKRGRVMSLHMMSFMGAGPFGSLWAGATATHIGAPNTLLLGAGLCLLGALAFGTQAQRVQKALKARLYGDDAAET